MATVISIQIGAQPAISRTYNITNAKAKDTLLALYAALDLGSADATDQAKGEAVIDWIAKTINDNARAKYRFDRRAAIDAEGAALYGFE